MPKKKVKIKEGIVTLNEKETTKPIKNKDGKWQRAYFSPERPTKISFVIHNKHLIDFYIILSEKKINPEKFFSNCIYALLGDLDISIKEIAKESKKNNTSTLLAKVEQVLIENNNDEEKIFVEVDEDMPDL